MIACMHEAELLVEIEDDLKDYGKDVARNSFNIYRVYAREYRERAAEEMAAFIAQIEERYLKFRAAAMDEGLLAAHIARNEEQSSAGPAMAPSTGRWEIPVPILDEEPLRRLSAGVARVPLLFVPPGSTCGVGSEEVPSARCNRLHEEPDVVGHHVGPNFLSVDVALLMC
mmetsp:Transcript_30406/g.101002  ORF Transcript_30406/g.101002 Transcript_30406/m.101002 type:complete len:170 (+) Transcript_30406:502-1011(+)